MSDPVVRFVVGNPIGPNREGSIVFELANVAGDHQADFLENIPSSSLLTGTAQGVPPKPFLPPLEQLVQRGGIAFPAAEHEQLLFGSVVRAHAVMVRVCFPPQ